MATLLENIAQAERLLAELKQNIESINSAKMDDIRAFQTTVENRYHFPKYCLHARMSVRAYFRNQYADMIYRVLTNTNTGIPIKVIPH